MSNKLMPFGPSFYNPNSKHPWWEQIPKDFHLFNEKFKLDSDQTRTLSAVSFSDYIFRTFIAITFSARNLVQATELLTRDYRQQWRQYESISKAADFFKQPDTLPDVDRHRAYQEPQYAKVEDLSFQSPFDTVVPSFSKHYWEKGHPKLAVSRFYSHNDKPRPVCICLHGFVVDGYQANEFIFNVPKLYEWGFDVLLYTMPAHGERRLPEARYSGDGFVSIDVAAINETVAHSIHDLRIFIRYLESIGHDTIGATGVSLGGFHTSLLAALEPNLAFAIPQIPVASLLDLSLEWEPMSFLIRNLIKVFQYSIQEARHGLAITSPLSHPAVIDKERLWIIAGAGDRMASPKQAKLLWEHWHRPKMDWFIGNHLLHLEREKIFAKKHTWFKKRGII